MSKHEQSGRPATAAAKDGGCCGKAHDHDCGSSASKVTQPGRKPALVGPDSARHTRHETDHSCGCGGKHK
jgi:hypothetical protein